MEGFLHLQGENLVTERQFLFSTLKWNSALFLRLFFVGARKGHMPRAMALINFNKNTPMPCLIILVSWNGTWKIILTMTGLCSEMQMGDLFSRVWSRYWCWLRTMFTFWSDTPPSLSHSSQQSQWLDSYTWGKNYCLFPHFEEVQEKKFDTWSKSNQSCLL